MKILITFSDANAEKLYQQWAVEVPNPPCHKVCYNGIKSVEVYRVGK